MSPGFRFIGRALEEFLTGVPSRDIPPEHFDQLDPEAQQTLTDHVAHNPNPIFVQDDSVTASAEPAAASAEPAAAPVEPTAVPAAAPADDDLQAGPIEPTNTPDVKADEPS
ncbi:MAG: hypothetical protein NVSMB2_25450 [Chloroflexota bacterium]